MLPNFIVIGAAKCGTTSVCDLLGKHPDVFMCEPKEPCFFSHMDENERTREWYESLFQQAGSEPAVGEGSTAYTHPDVIERTAAAIKALIPDCRLIYMVRHPLKRLESDWRMRRHEGWTPAAIGDAVTEQPSLMTHGFYWQNLGVYRRNFPDEQILVVFLEDFVRDPNGELQRCLQHIGVDPDFTVEDAARPRNSAADFRKDGRIAARLRQLAAFETVKDALPVWFVQGAKGLLTRQERFPVEWDPEIRRRTIAQLREDAAHFLSHCGKPEEFWDFST